MGRLVPYVVVFAALVSEVAGGFVGLSVEPCLKERELVPSSLMRGTNSRSNLHRRFTLEPTGYWLVRHHWCRPVLVDWFRRVGCDLQVSAVVIGISTWLVIPVVCHELNYLQSTFVAVDVWDRDVSLPGRHRSLRSKGSTFAFFRVWIVNEQAVSDDRNLRRALNRSPD